MTPRPRPQRDRRAVPGRPGATPAPRASRLRRRIVPIVALAALPAMASCGNDDGAQVRGPTGTGSVSIVGPAPESGGSVSATGTGCSTRGSTTRLESSSLSVSLDDGRLEAPATATEGVIRFVAKNFGSQPHELWVLRADDIAEVPKTGGRLDEDAMGSVPFWRIRSFPANTICLAFFTLEPGTYLLVDDLLPDGATETNLAAGMIATLTVNPSTAPPSTFTLPTNPDGTPVLTPPTEP